MLWPAVSEKGPDVRKMPFWRISHVQLTVMAPPVFVIVKIEFPAPSHDPVTTMFGGAARADPAASSAAARAPARKTPFTCAFKKRELYLN
jgi:hypothetical protein